MATATRTGCSVSSCDRPHSSKGYCKMHAERVRRNGHPDRVDIVRPLAERFAEKVDVRGPDECWPWTGTVSVKNYGSIAKGGRTGNIAAHRVAYILAHPDLPVPEVIDHLCHDPEVCALGNDCPHRRCCNPAHLGASTLQENGSAERQFRPNTLKTHCPRGHEYNEENTERQKLPSGNVGRRCRVCHDSARRKRYAETYVRVADRSVVEVSS